MTLQYKTFTWPQGISRYQVTLRRMPRYTLEAGVKTFQGMSPEMRTIAGEGVFYGSHAGASYQALERLFQEGTPGNLISSRWGSYYCYLTELELLQEPKENCLHYRFVFTGALPGGEIPG